MLALALGPSLVCWHAVVSRAGTGQELVHLLE